MAGSTAPGTVVAQLIESMRALAGSHPGFRPAHAKGIVCSGTFRASPDARRVTPTPSRTTTAARESEGLKIPEPGRRAWRRRLDAR